MELYNFSSSENSLVFYFYFFSNCEIPQKLEKIHCADFFPDYEEGFRQLIRVFQEKSDIRYASNKILYKPEKIEIPFVVMAMTHNEAIELKNENILSNDKKLSLFDCECIKQYLKNLSDDKINDFTAHYGDSREEWIPYKYSQYYSFHQNFQNPEYKYSNFSIKQIVRNMLEEYCQNHSHVNIEPLFISADFFSDKEGEYRKARKCLDRSGGVLLIDGVSLLYPHLYRCLSGSGLISNPTLPDKKLRNRGSEVIF